MHLKLAQWHTDTISICASIATEANRRLQSLEGAKIKKNTDSYKLLLLLHRKPRTHQPEQLVALLVCVGLQLHNRLILLDEFEQLWGVQLRITVVIWLREPGQRSISENITYFWKKSVKPIRTEHRTCGDTTFSVAAPSLWNTIPKHIRDCTELSTFETLTKSHHISLFLYIFSLLF